MELMQISKKDFKDFMETLVAGDVEVDGVVRKENQYAFEKLENADDLCLDYDETILPPKKFFLPTKEVLLQFKTKDASSYEDVRTVTERIIVGIHPGDLTAIALLDKAFAEGESDIHYQEKRENSTLIGIYPTVPFKHRFSSSMIKDEYYSTADLMLADIGNDMYAVEVVTDKGKKLIGQSKAVPGKDGLAEMIEKSKTAVPDQKTLSVKRDDLSELLTGKEDHPVFKEHAEKCFSCGSCLWVCPTCYCFDVEDEVDLSLEKGERNRKWDGCMIQNFAEVAGDHNFREEAANRLRHRVFRKGKYLLDRFGVPGCVGCGRCVRACVANIASPLEIINKINGKEN